MSQRVSVDSHSKVFYQIQLVTLQILPFQIQMYWQRDAVQSSSSRKQSYPMLWMAAVIAFLIAVLLQLMTAEWLLVALLRLRQTSFTNGLLSYSGMLQLLHTLQCSTPLGLLSSLVTECCTVIGLHSTVWRNKLIYSKSPDPFPT